MPNCSSTCCFELLDPQRRLGFGDFVAVQRVGERRDPGAQLGDLLARPGQRARALPAFGGQLGRGRATPRRPPRSIARRPGGRTRRPRPPPPRRVRAPRGRAGRAAWPRVRPRRRGAANPPVRERHSRVPRRSARPAGPPPRRPGRPRRRPSIPARSAGSASNSRCLLARCAAGPRARRVPRRSAPGPASSSSRCWHQPLPLVVGGAGVLARAGRAARRSPRSRRRIR